METVVTTFFNAWNDPEFQRATAPFAPDAVVFDPDKIEGPEEIGTWATAIFVKLREFSIAVSDHKIRTKGTVA